MEDLNNVPSSGTYGAAINKVNANFSLIVNAINSLEYQTTRSKGILNYGTNPATAFPNAVKGDWCMILSEGNIFPATIKTFNGSTWSGSSTWNPEGLDLTGYATKDEMTAAITKAVSEVKIETVDNLNEETAASGKALDAHQGFVLAGQIKGFVKDGQPDSDLDITDESKNVLVRFANGHIETKNFKSSQLPALATKNNENFDFTIEDEAGDAIVLFKNGHIKTKNFNSANLDVANYLKDKFRGKKIAIVGDSISTYNGWLPSSVPGFSGTTYATYYPQGDVNSVDKTWWYQVAQNLGINTTDIANTSWSGGTVCGDSTSTTNGKPACSTKRISDIAIRGFIPDIILVFISCNDWYQCGLSGYSTTLGDWRIIDPIPAEGTIHKFRNAYALMLAKIRQTYPLSRVFCCTILDDFRRDGIADDESDNAWPPNNAAGITTTEWNNNIKEIAEAFACDVIDMHDCGITYFNIRQNYAVDAGLHPNAAGHALMARKVTSELMSKY